MDNFWAKYGKFDVYVYIYNKYTITILNGIQLVYLYTTINSSLVFIRLETISCTHRHFAFMTKLFSTTRYTLDNISGPPNAVRYIMSSYIGGGGMVYGNHGYYWYYHHVGDSLL